MMRWMPTPQFWLQPSNANAFASSGLRGWQIPLSKSSLLNPGTRPPREMISIRVRNRLTIVGPEYR